MWTFYNVGKFIGFGIREEGSFVWCGKRIRRAEDKTIRMSMSEHHQNLKEIYVSKSRRNDAHARMTLAETRQLKALPGSFQWLVAQFRFDMSFAASALQGEKPTVPTVLLKSNAALRELQKDCGFELIFWPVDMATCGILLACGAALGNVNRDGSADDAVVKKVLSQAGYWILCFDRWLQPHVWQARLVQYP